MNIGKLIKNYGNYGIRLWVQNDKLKFSAPTGVMTEERKNDIRRYKEDIIEYLKDINNSVITHNEDGRYDDFSLTPIQASYVIGKTNTFEYGGIGCQIYVEVSLENVDINRLNVAWQKVVERHDMLKAIVLPNGYQRVLKDVNIPKITETVVSTEKDFNSVCIKTRDIMQNKVYSSEKWPLFDLGVTKYRDSGILHFSMDMLIGDSVSVGIIMKELLYYYEDGIEMQPLEVTYRDYIRFREKMSSAPESIERYQKDKKYWLEKITDFPSAPELFVNHNNDAYKDIEFVHKRTVLEKEIWDKLKNVASSLDITPSCLLLSAYSEVLGRWSKTKRYSINVTSMNRENVHPQVYNIIGDFTDVLLIESELDTTKTFKERTVSLQNTLLSALEHKSFSGVEVIREIARLRGNNEIFPYVYTSTLGIENLEDDRAEITYRVSRTPQVFIDCQVGNRNGALEICWDVRKSAFTGNTIQEMFDAYIDVLNKLAISEEYTKAFCVAELPEETLKVRNEVNNTKQDIPEKLLYEDFLYNVETMPEKTALICNDVSYSYRTLYKYATGAYEAIRNADIKAGEKVAISARKSLFQVASVIGTLMAGCVYVPLDISQPPERLKTIINNVGTRFAFLDSEVNNKLTDIDITVCSELSESNEKCVPVAVSVTDPAYIIYTSGSTGIPKGVVISHDGAMNTIQDINNKFSVTDKDSVLGTVNLAFDLSVYDLFGMFSAGGTLILPDEKKLNSAEYLYRIMKENNITVWNSVPAQMEILVSIKNQIEGKLDSLRIVMLSGDWISTALPKELSQIAPSALVYSLGGATEASIWSIYHKITKEDTKRVSIPYGKPLANQQFYVLDSNLMQVPNGIIGDLYIAGRGLALEYYNDPEMTSSKFIMHKELNKRLYRTGDLGRYEEDGVIEFIGREDNQVKLHGHRIELGEIETALNSHEKVLGSATVVTGKTDNDKKLFAFVVPEVREKESYQQLSDTLNTYLNPIADEITKDINGEAFQRYMQYASDLALTDIVLFFNTKGLFIDSEQSYNYKEILEKTNARPEYFKLVKRWLNALVEEGYLEKNGEQNYRLIKLVQQDDSDKLKVSINKENEEKLGSQMSTNYFDNSIENVSVLLDGTIEPQEILFPKASTETAFNVYHDNIFSKCMNNVAVKAILKAVDIIIAENPEHTIRILEIGAGTGGTSDDILPHLVGKNVEYHFTDVSAFFLNKAREKYTQYPWMVYHTFDINSDYRKQGVEESYFDIILCANVLHMAHNGDDAFRTMKAISNSKGFLVIIDAVKELNSLLTSMGFLYRVDATDARGEQELVFFKLDHWYRNFKNAEAEILYKYPSEDHFLSCSYQRIFISRFNGEKEVVSNVDLKKYLENKIPDYMIPSKITIIDKIPLTENKKLDRKELKRIAELDNRQMRKEGASTESELEKQVEKIWMEVLNRDVEIGKEANFFEIGGDSLLLAQTIGRVIDEVEIAKGMEWEDMMRMMIKNNTISLFCNALQNHSKNSSSKLMHVFSEGEESSDEVIALFSDGTGRMIIYNPLLELLLEKGCKKKIIGFNMALYDTFLDEPDKDVIANVGVQCGTELLKYINKKITLLGHCYGGVVALETAKFLKAHGNTPKLVMIESKRYDDPVTNEFILERGFATLVGSDLKKAGYDITDEEIGKLLEDYMKENQKPIGTLNEEEFVQVILSRIKSDYYSRVLQTTQDERINMIFDAISADREKHSSYEYKQFKSIYLTFKKSMGSIIAYNEESYDGDVISYYSLDKQAVLKAYPMPLSYFSDQFTTGNVKKKQINGSHIGCMSKENVIVLIDELM